MIECSSFGKENLSAKTHFLFISLFSDLIVLSKEPEQKTDFCKANVSIVPWCPLQVINDWPNHFDTLEEYLADIRVFLKNKNITIEAIQSKLVTLDPSKNAWEIESLTGLLDLMNNKIRENTIPKFNNNLFFSKSHNFEVFHYLNKNK